MQYMLSDYNMKAEQPNTL